MRAAVVGVHAHRRLRAGDRAGTKTVFFPARARFPGSLVDASWAVCCNTLRANRRRADRFGGAALSACAAPQSGPDPWVGVGPVAGILPVREEF